MKVLINTLIADLFLKLYTSVGWIAPCKEQVERALENTLASKNGFEERPCEWDGPGMFKMIKNISNLSSEKIH